MSFDDLVKLASSFFAVDRQNAANGLLALYRSGDQRAGFELAEMQCSPDIETGLEISEVVQLLICNIRENANPGAMLDLFYYYQALVPKSEMKELLAICAPNSVTAQEALDNWED